MYDPKIRALALHTGYDVDDIFVSDYDPYRFEVGRREYLVMTDDEATDAARDQIADLWWAFNTVFLASYIPALGITAACNAFDKMREALCEDANAFVVALLGDRESEATDDAIAADGRGHFLAGYDDEEHEETVDGATFYIYREN